MGVVDHNKSKYMELQRKKVHRYVIFKIDEEKKKVVVEKTGGLAESYDDFTTSLLENNCRYEVYDFDFVTSENCQKSKIFFITCLYMILKYRANRTTFSKQLPRITSRLLLARRLHLPDMARSTASPAQGSREAVALGFDVERWATPNGGGRVVLAELEMEVVDLVRGGGFRVCVKGEIT
ncbi:hypothetical protein LguiB_000527 [Lonicera macranthoides]